MKHYIINLILCAVSSFCASVKKCKIEDTSCLTSSAQELLPEILSGIPSLGVETSDPLYVEAVESVEPSLTHKYTKVTVNGFKGCEINNVRLSLEKATLNFDLYCTLNIAGDYEIHGRVLILPVEGNGKFSVKAKRLQFNIDAETKQVQGNDGKIYLGIKNFKLKVNALDQVTFDYRNLFNGNRELGDTVINFANTNYKEVTQEFSGPIFYGYIKKIFKNVNKYLKSEPIDTFLE